MQLQRLWIQLTANRKQFGVFCAAVAVGLLLWARLIVVSNIPRTAMAGDKAPPSHTAGEGKQPRTSSVVRTDAAEEQAVSPPRIQLTVYLDVQPLRDPFMVSEAHFPRLNPPNTLTQEHAKSAPERTEDPEQAEAAQTARLAAMANKLTLEAIATLTPLAVISGRTYRIGETIPSPTNQEILFRLTEVKRRSVILECEGRRFELSMKSAGQ